MCRRDYQMTTYVCRLEILERKLIGTEYRSSPSTSSWPEERYNIIPTRLPIFFYSAGLSVTLSWARGNSCHLKQICKYVYDWTNDVGPVATRTTYHLRRLSVIADGVVNYQLQLLSMRQKNRNLEVIESVIVFAHQKCRLFNTMEGLPVQCCTKT